MGLNLTVPAKFQAYLAFHKPIFCAMNGEVRALVDIGASKTDINIMRGNTSYFQREIFMAGNDLTMAAAAARRAVCQSELNFSPSSRTRRLRKLTQAQ